MVWGGYLCYLAAASSEMNPYHEAVSWLVDLLHIRNLELENKAMDSTECAVANNLECATCW